MKKILFLIHDLGQGGAEKVLVNLVNNMDHSKFDITVMTLFDWGVNRQYLSSKIHYKTWCRKMFPGNSHLMKLLSPQQLHRMIIKEHYDIEIAYLEGPCARVISGCTDKKTKLISWIHCTFHDKVQLSKSFRGYKEALECYNRMDSIIFVSKEVKQSFLNLCPIKTPNEVLYNTNDSDRILRMKDEPVENNVFCKDEIKLCAVGKIVPLKGFDRLARIHKRLCAESYPIHTYILGIGPEQSRIEQYLYENHIEKSFTFLGYKTNPYKYVSNCDLFVCTSNAEGFSTAATEALIVGTPVCTVEVSGMKEMLGENNEWGIVTENDDEALYQGIKRLLDESSLLQHYKNQAEIRGKDFNTQNTVKAVENMFNSLLEA